MNDAERRFTSVRVEVRAEDKRTIGGYALKFNRLSQNLGGFVEQVDTRALNKSAADGWPGVLARYNHDDNLLLGTTDARTLRLSVDDVGLRYDVDVPSARADVFELAQRGDISKSSFAFIAFEDDWATTDQGFPLRTLTSIRLLDVAPVNTPAYEDTSVGLRSLANKFDAPLDEVRRLAEANELVKFFKRTDGPPPEPRRSAAAAAAKVMRLDL